MSARRLPVSAAGVVSLALLLSFPVGPRSPEVTARAPENPPDVIAVMQAHYGIVADELEAADVSALSEAQRARRAEAVAELRAYGDRGVFGVLPELAGRAPRFKDPTGRLCAVANLMHASGADELLDGLAAKANEAYMIEVAGEPALLGWLDRTGLSLAEAARIHSPIRGGGAPTLPGGGPPSGGSPAPQPAAASASNRNSWGAGAMTGAASRSAAAPAAFDGGGSSTSRGGESGRGVRSGPAESSAAGEEWWVWWEMNKLRFLRPNRLESLPRSGLPPVGGTSPAAAAAAAAATEESMDAARAALLPLLLDATPPEDALLRGRAAVALGRIAGREAIPALTALLDDPQVFVRHAAIVGLGATGSMEAAPTLLDLATDGQDVSPWAQPLAAVALGLGRRHGMSATLDGFVADLASGSSTDLRTAVLLYHTLSPSHELQALALAALEDEDAPAALRCRATETLRLAGDAAELPRITRLLGDGDVEVRRSAALAMSGTRHPLALPALKTAYELEKEPLARGFVLLAIAEQGGPAAQDFLVKAARGGPSAVRPWAALALGLLTRSTPEGKAREAACDVLREGLKSDVNHSTRGAWMLAAGIARDAGSAPKLRKQMVGASDQKQRMFAALALGMIGDEEARPLMLEQLRHEEAPLAAIGLAQALGVYGIAADGPALSRAMLALPEPEARSHVALALAFHGSAAAVEALMDVARDAQAPAETRAAALNGLGLMLDPQPELMLAEVSAASNFTVFPEWVDGLLTGFTL